MPATRLCRTDAGKLIDGLKDLSELLENLGLADGNGQVHCLSLWR